MTIRWTICPACALRHTPRPDGRCPRCHRPLRGDAQDPPAAPGEAPAAPAEVEPRAFSVTELCFRTLATWPSLWVLALTILAALPGLLVYSRLTALRSGHARLHDPSLLLGLSLDFLLTPAQLLVTARIALRRLRGEPIEGGDLASAAARSYFSAVAVLLIVAVSLAVAFTTVIGAPMGLVLLAAGAASIPAMTAEGLGPLEALQRSADLTAGRRLELLGGLALLGFLVGAPYALLEVTLAGVGHPKAAEGASGELVRGAVEVGRAYLSELAASVMVVATAVAYHQLRTAKEGKLRVRQARISA